MKRYEVICHDDEAGSETVMDDAGEFYLADVPRIAKALESIAAELKRANDLKEEERAEEDGTMKDLAEEFIKGEGK